MLGEPVAPVPQALRVLGEIAGVAESLAGIGTFGDRGEIEDRERRHEPAIDIRTVDPMADGSHPARHARAHDADF